MDDVGWLQPGSGRPAKPHNVVHCLFEVLIATSKSPVSIRSFQRLPMLSIYGVIRKLSPSNCIGSHTPVKPEILDQNPSRHYRATKQRYQRLIVRFGHVPLVHYLRPNWFISPQSCFAMDRAIGIIYWI